MKVFVLALAILATSVIAENVDIDWSNVRPIEYYPQFWDDKPAELRPPASVFEDFESRIRSGRIVGGSIATPHQFPYQVALLAFLPSIGGSALCGGSILSNRFILTAAHCVDGATSGTVILGAHDRTNANEANQVRVTFGAADIRMHEAWDPSLIRNDIALIRMPTTVTLNQFIVPVRLPTTAELGSDFAGELGVISGWGVYSDDAGLASNVLRFVYDNIMTNLGCSIRFPGVIQATNVCVTGTNGRGACSGDSGGPLTVQRGGESVVIGVVSFGLALGCELAWPSVFARVTSFTPWIQNNMNTWN